MKAFITLIFLAMIATPIISLAEKANPNNDDPIVDLKNPLMDPGMYLKSVAERVAEYRQLGRDLANQPCPSGSRPKKIESYSRLYQLCAKLDENGQEIIINQSSNSWGRYLLVGTMATYYEGELTSISEFSGILSRYNRNLETGYIIHHIEKENLYVTLKNEWGLGTIDSLTYSPGNYIVDTFILSEMNLPFWSFRVNFNNELVEFSYQSHPTVTPDVPNRLESYKVHNGRFTLIDIILTYYN